MGKGVAVPYIVGIVLAIIVIGVLGYLFFSSAGKTTNTVSGAECTAKKLQYCSSQSQADLTELNKVCGINGFQTGTSCYDFCSRIPGWAPSANAPTSCKAPGKP